MQLMKLRKMLSELLAPLQKFSKVSPEQNNLKFFDGMINFYILIKRSAKNWEIGRYLI